MCIRDRNITVLSNMGNMDIGVIACPDIAPDVDEVTDGIVDAIEVLRQAAVAAVEAEATEPKTPAVKKSPAKKAPAKKAPAKKSPAKKAPAKKAPAKKAT